MTPLIALAARVFPGILKAIADDPRGSVKDAVTEAVTQAIAGVTGLSDPKSAAEKLKDDPALQAELERSAVLQERLAGIALDQERARIAAETERLRIQSETALRLTEQSATLETKFAALDAASQQGARSLQKDLINAGSPISFAPAILSVVVVAGFFLVFLAFMIGKSHLEAVTPPTLPPPESWAQLSDAEKAALLRPPSDFVIQIINILVGTLAAGFATVLSFWLGSSQGSRVKDRQIAAATVAAESANDAASQAKDALTTSEKARSAAEEARDKAFALAPPEVREILGAGGTAPPAAPPVWTAAPGTEGRDSPAPPPIPANVLDAELARLTVPHRQFPGSIAWALVADGISVDRGPAERTGGSPDTVTRIWRDYGPLCAEAARSQGVPVELIVATIATESKGDPNAERGEPQLNDRSVGLMQTLIATASEEMGRRLTASDLHDPRTSITAGTLYIARRRRTTHYDPPLVAASYNAGALYREDAAGNRWRLRCYPKGTGRHLDNFAAWFGDAMRVSAAADWSDGGRVPSFAHMLRGAAPGGDGGPAASPPGGDGPPAPAASAAPPRPDFPARPDDAAKNELFGQFDYRPDPQPDNVEHIRILGDWTQRNIVEVVLPGPPRLDPIRTEFHRLAAPQLIALWEEWRAAGLLDRILTFDGAFNPRFQRGSTTRLSNHAWGTAFDINAAQNPLDREPARAGRKGCVWELVPAAHRHGFFWGGHFRSRKDGMHFEVARIMPPA